jgi:hypothetical protein
MPFFDQSTAQLRAQKAGSASDQNSFEVCHVLALSSRSCRQPLVCRTFPAKPGRGTELSPIPYNSLGPCRIGSGVGGSPKLLRSRREQAPAQTSSVSVPFGRSAQISDSRPARRG